MSPVVVSAFQKRHGRWLRQGKQRKGNKMSPVAGTKMNRSVVPVSSSSANLGRPAEVRTLEDMMQAVRPLVQQLDRSQA